jgi:tryptophan 2,3-dioxygenase
MDAADEFDESDNQADTEDSARNIRPATISSQWLKTRRRIEQARETRELNKSLADLEDYIV